MPNPTVSPVEKGMCAICHRYRERRPTPKEQLLLCDECWERFGPTEEVEEVPLQAHVVKEGEDATE